MSEITDPFDSLGSTYEVLAQTPFRRFLEAPSVLGVLGELSGKSVIDVGCGPGDYCRWLAERGAARVVGYDRSAAMIEHARLREERDRRGIEYVTELPMEQFAGRFDLVLSVYVLPYATSRAELLRLCTEAKELLREGGRYVTLPIHPDFPFDEPEYYRSYGFRLFTQQAPSDGMAVTLELFFSGKPEILTARYWSRETLSLVLLEAGLQQVVWHPYHACTQGVESEGEAYFEPYLLQPHAAIVEARRAGEAARKP